MIYKLKIKANIRIIMKIFIAVPAYQGMCHIKFMESVSALFLLLTKNNIDFHFFTLTSESLISRARNICATHFLKSDCTHMMFIDTDIVFHPKDVIKMLALDLNVVCGVYPYKTLSFDSLKKNMNVSNSLSDLITKSALYCIEKNSYQDQICITEYAQTGFMLIKKNVLIKIKDEYHDDIVYENDISGYEVYSDNNKFYDFFKICIDKGRYLSEDYGFCSLVKKVKEHIHIDTSIHLTHIGQFHYYG